MATPTPPTIHAQWKAEDIAALIPGMSEEVLRYPEHINFDKVEEEVNDVLSRLSRIDTLLASPSFRKFRDTKDINELAQLFNRIDEYSEDAAGLSAFISILKLYVEAQPAEMRDRVNKLFTRVDVALDRHVEQGAHMLRSICAHVDDDMQARIDKDVTLGSYARLIHYYRDGPVKSDRQPHDTAHDTDLLSSARTKLAHASDTSSDLPTERRNTLLAEGLQEVIAYKHMQAKKKGYSSTNEQFSDRNELPHAFVDPLLKQIEHATATIKVAHTKLKEEYIRHHLDKTRLPSYSWQEAKDIVCNAWEKVSPELGSVARMAFDDQWIYSRSPVNSVQADQPVMIDTTRHSHPFAFVPFKGKAADIIMLGHEVGHLIAGNLSIINKRPLQTSASTLIQENFALVGEELTAKEMLRRAGQDPTKRFQAKEAKAYHDICNLVIVGERLTFEHALYDRVAHNAPPLDYKELTALYHEKCPLAGGDLHQLPLLHIAQQMPHSLLAYPMARMMAPAMAEQALNNPRKGHAFCNFMASGSTFSSTRMWNEMIGDEWKNQEFFTKRLADIVGNIEEATNEIRKIPPATKGTNAPINDVGKFIDDFRITTPLQFEESPKRFQSKSLQQRHRKEISSPGEYQLI